jgi:hypothetical protein
MRLDSSFYCSISYSLFVFSFVSQGLGSAVCPLYVNELAPESRRGMLSSVFQLTITFGIIVAYLAAFLMHDVVDMNMPVSAAENVAHYSLLMHLGSAIGVFCVILALAMPESAIWLRQHRGGGLGGLDGKSDAASVSFFDIDWRAVIFFLIFNSFFFW